MLKNTVCRAVILLLILSPMTPLSAAPAQAPLLNEEEQSLIDHKASVYHLEGTAKLLARGADQWKDLTLGTIIREGDKIKTGANSAVEIYYDKFLQNQVRIEPESLAEFKSIEPTSLSISEGSIFNILDGLPKGATYEVKTPTAVASIRGTHFVISHLADQHTDQTSVTSGAVQLFRLKDSVQPIASERSFMVHSKNSMLLKFSSENPDEFIGSEPGSMLPSEYDRYEENVKASRKRLIESQGGGKAFMRALDSWMKLKENPAKMNLILSEILTHGKSRLITQGLSFETPDAIITPQDKKSPEDEGEKASAIVSGSIIGKDQDAKQQDALLGAAETELNASDAAEDQDTNEGIDSPAIKES